MNAPSRKNLASLLAILLIVAAFGAYLYSKNRPFQRPGEPQRSVEEVLQERARQAELKVESPLGKAVSTKNWNEFDQIYHPEAQAMDFADIIRGIFIQNKMKEFSEADSDQLFKRMLITLKAIPENARNRIGILITQFQRLPLPSKESDAYKTLNSWAKSPSESPFFRRLAILKITASDLRPDPEIVKLFLKGYSHETFGASRIEWIRSTEDIRNVHTREEALKTLSKLYPTLDKKFKPYALSTLARDPNIETKNLLNYMFQSLKQNETLAIESGLKAIPGLLEIHQISETQKAKITERLDKIPSDLMTPFTREKVKEIRALLTKPSKP